MELIIISREVTTHPAWHLPTAIADKKGKGGAVRAPFNLSARRAPSRRGKGCPRGGPQPKEGDGGRLSPVGWVRGAFPLGECEGDRGSGWGIWWEARGERAA